MSQEPGGGAAIIGQTAQSVMAADLADLDKKHVLNTLELASRHANALVPEGANSWSWFHHYVSAITKFGWTAHTAGPQDVDPNTDPITGVANTDSTPDSTRQQTAWGILGLFGQTKPLGGGMSFTVTGVGLKDGILTMQMVGLETQYTGTWGFFGQSSSSKRVRREIVDFTANKAFLDANQQDVERRLAEIARDAVEDTPLD